MYVYLCAVRTLHSNYPRVCVWQRRETTDRTIGGRRWAGDISMFLPRNLHIVTFTTQPGQFAPCIANQPNEFVHKKPIKQKRSPLRRKFTWFSRWYWEYASVMSFHGSTNGSKAFNVLSPFLSLSLFRTLLPCLHSMTSTRNSHKYIIINYNETTLCEKLNCF